MKTKSAGTVYIKHYDGNKTKVDLTWKTKDLQYVRTCAKKLYKLAEEAGLPFKLRRNKLRYTGPENKVEDYVLDLYELVLFEAPDMAENLDGTFEKIIPEYSNYLGRINKERWQQVEQGNVEFDGLNFHATDKALEEIADQRNFYADTAAYVSFLPGKNKLKEQLKSLGISTNNSAMKAVLAGGIMLAAGLLGSALAKDVQADSSDDNSRQNPDAVLLSNEHVSLSDNPAIYENKVVWGAHDGVTVYDAGLDGIFGTGDDSKTNISDTYRSSADIHQDNVVWDDDADNIYLHKLSTGKTIKISSDDSIDSNPKIYGDNVVWESHESISLYNIKTGQREKIIDNTWGVPNIWEDKVVYTDGGGANVKLYNITTGKITTLAEHPTFRATTLDISKDKVVWTEEKSATCENKGVYLQDLISGKETFFEGKDAHIYGNKVVYWNHKTKTLKVLDLETDKDTTIVENQDIQDINPAIWKNKIVWIEYDDNHFEPIYLLDLGPEDPIPNLDWKNGDYFIHATDTHVYENNDRLEDYVNKINSLEKKPKFVIVSGDLVDWGAGESGQQNFEKFIEIMDKLDTDWYVVPGNHDCRNGAGSASIPIPLEGDRFVNYYAQIPAEHDLTYRLKDKGEVVIIGVNSGWDELNLDTSPFPPEGSGLSNEQIASLESKLDSLDGVKDDKDSSGKKKIIVMHHPTHWQNEQHKDDGVFLHNRDTFIKLCEDYGVDIVLAGHTHEGAVRDDGTKWIVTAAAGEDAAYRKVTYSDGELVVGEQEVFEETLTGTVDCPAKITMYDDSGQKVNSEVQELPGAFYSGWETNGENTETVSAYGHDYYFVVEGTDKGTVRFSMSRDGENIFITEPLEISKGQKIKFDPKLDDVVVSNDKDGNGKPECALVVSDGELTAKEWKDVVNSPEEKEFGPGCYVAGATIVLAGPLASIYGLYRQKKKTKSRKKKKHRTKTKKTKRNIR